MEIMENLKKRYNSVHDALDDLSEIIDIVTYDPVGKVYYKHMRKSEIQNFEFTIDTFWKLLKEYLLYAYKINVDIPTPKKVFRECLNVKLISQDEFDLLLKAIDARNVTSHTYHEELAEEIASKVPAFYATILAIFERIVIE